MCFRAAQGVSDLQISQIHTLNYFFVHLKWMAPVGMHNDNKISTSTTFQALRFRALSRAESCPVHKDGGSMLPSKIDVDATRDTERKPSAVTVHT